MKGLLVLGSTIMCGWGISAMTGSGVQGIMVAFWWFIFAVIGALGSGSNDN